MNNTEIFMNVNDLLKIVNDCLKALSLKTNVSIMWLFSRNEKER